MSPRPLFLSLFPQSRLLLFNRLRTLSFSVAHLSPVSTVLSALFHQKPGVYPLWSDQSHFSTVPSDHPSSSLAVDCQLSTVGCLLLLHSPPIHNPVTGPSPILLPLLSQCSPVRGPTHTPCLSLSERLRYTSTNSIHRATSAHEARTDH